MLPPAHVNVNSPPTWPGLALPAQFACPVVRGDKWIAQKFKGFPSVRAHQHRKHGLWGSQTPTDLGIDSAETHKKA